MVHELLDKPQPPPPHLSPKYIYTYKKKDLISTIDLSMP